MKAFQILLVLQFIGIIAYTIAAGASFGWDLASVFFGNLTALNWSGQFNYDFLCYLLLSGLWIAWRSNFSVPGILLGGIASVLGILFFAPYLLFLIYQTKGNIPSLLMGARSR